MKAKTSIARGRRAANRLLERLRRSISEFLAIPILIVAAFLALALALYTMDHDAGSEAHWGPLRTYLGRYVGDNATSIGLLTTIAGSLITVTSITFSILLLAVQQGASALTSQIIDHYLRRPSNRVYFGFFVGTSVFALVTLVLTNANSRPVLGVTVATVLAGVALFALVLLIYSTIDQIRPVSIISTIHDTALQVRVAQLKLLRNTADRAPAADAGVVVRSDRNGYLARIRVAELSRLAEARPGCTIALPLAIGDPVACGAPIAVVAGAVVDDALERGVRHALPIEEQRDVGCDAAFGVDHLVNIAWTSTSTAKSNPAVALAACHALGDILFRWAGDDEGGFQDDRAPIHYRDPVMDQLFDGLETLALVTSESMQQQTLAVLMDAIAEAFPRCSRHGRDRLDALLMMQLAGLGDHMPTTRLERAFGRAGAALRSAGRHDSAARLSDGWAVLAATRGVVRSRGNRDQGAGDPPSAA